MLDDELSTFVDEICVFGQFLHCLQDVVRFVYAICTQTAFKSLNAFKSHTNFEQNEKTLKF